MVKIIRLVADLSTETLKGKAGCPSRGLQAPECWASAGHHFVPDTTRMDTRGGLARPGGHANQHLAGAQTQGVA